MTQVIDMRASTSAPEVERAVLAELRGLRASVPHVLGLLVAGVDGLLVAADLDGVQPEVLAAMSAAQLGLGQQVVATVHTGDLRETVTTGSAGYVATFAAGGAALLTVVAGPELNVALLHHAARPAAVRIGALVTPTDHG